jgi:hypothetical protein
MHGRGIRHEDAVGNKALQPVMRLPACVCGSRKIVRRSGQIRSDRAAILAGATGEELEDDSMDVEDGGRQARRSGQ